MSDQPTEQQPAPQLSLADLALMAQTINVCTKRGAFNAEEMRPVGELFDKLKAFVEAANKAAEEQKKLDSVTEGGAESKDEADGSGEGEAPEESS
tara:strand:+ start:682 stop:966 length:285 start_codon:yes stop_codon:yes gene_type:complete